MKKRIFFLCGVMIFLTGCQSNISSKIEVVTLIKTTKSWNGAKLPRYSDGTPEITILKITIPPKTKLPLHEHPGINAGVLLKGNLRVISEDKDTLNLKTGDPIVEIVNTWHYGENLGTEPAEIIVFYAGEEGKPITVTQDGHHH